MNSFECAEGEWTEEYAVHETRYQDRRWWRSEKIVVVGQRECDNKRRVLRIPPDTASVRYEERDDVRLTLHKSIVTSAYVDFMGCGCYSLEEITSAEFRVPQGHEIPGVER